MKIIISQWVQFENDKFPYHWTKEFESELIPVVGMDIEDPLWKEPDTYKIDKVTINYNENYYYVEVEKYSPVISQKVREDMEKAAQLHGWNLPWKEKL